MSLALLESPYEQVQFFASNILYTKVKPCSRINSSLRLKISRYERIGENFQLNNEKKFLKYITTL